MQSIASELAKMSEKCFFFLIFIKIHINIANKIRKEVYSYNYVVLYDHKQIL